MLSLPPILRPGATRWQHWTLSPSLRLDLHFPQGYSYQQTLDYAKNFFTHFWRNDRRLLDVDLEVLKASIMVLDASSDNWACMRFGVSVPLFHNWLLRKVNQMRHSWSHFLCPKVHRNGGDLQGTRSLVHRAYFRDIVVFRSHTCQAKIVVPWMAGNTMSGQDSRSQGIWNTCSKCLGISRRVHRPV